MSRPPLALGYMALALAQVAISINVVTSKFLVASLPMFFILAARFGISTILLGTTLVLTKTPNAILVIHNKDYPCKIGFMRY